MADLFSFSKKNLHLFPSIYKPKGTVDFLMNKIDHAVTALCSFILDDCICSCFGFYGFFGFVFVCLFVCLFFAFGGRVGVWVCREGSLKKISDNN